MAYLDHFSSFFKEKKAAGEVDQSNVPSFISLSLLLDNIKSEGCRCKTMKKNKQKIDRFFFFIFCFLTIPKRFVIIKSHARPPAQLRVVHGVASRGAISTRPRFHEKVFPRPRERWRLETAGERKRAELREVGGTRGMSS